MTQDSFAYDKGLSHWCKDTPACSMQVCVGGYHATMMLYTPCIFEIILQKSPARIGLFCKRGLQIRRAYQSLPPYRCHSIESCEYRAQARCMPNLEIHTGKDIDTDTDTDRYTYTYADTDTNAHKYRQTDMGIDAPV